MNNFNQTGNLLSLEALLDFIVANQSSFKNIGCIDLTNHEHDHDHVHDEILEQLEFQEIKKINQLPDELAKIFKLNHDNFHKYIHVGVFKNIELEKNKFTKFDISLFLSIFSCLYQTFNYQTKYYQSIFVTKFLDRFIKSIQSTKYDCNFKTFQYEYKYQWSHEDLCNDIEHGDWNEKVLKYLSDFLHINIFILDISQDKLLYCGGAVYIPYKKTIFLLKYDNYSYEPFYTEQSKTFNLNDTIIKTLKESYDDINVMQLSNELLIFKEELVPENKTESEEDNENNSKNIVNGYDDLEQTDTKYEIADISEQESEQEQDSEQEQEQEKIKINSSMKLSELQNMAKKLNIKCEVNKKKKTKKQLLDEIKKITKKSSE
jgi:hypothetical protein